MTYTKQQLEKMLSGYSAEKTFHDSRIPDLATQCLELMEALTKIIYIEKGLAGIGDMTLETAQQALLGGGK